MRLAHITWPQAEEYFKNNDTVILSVGSIECHGKHNPLGTDTLIPMKLLDLIEEKTEALILPTLPYGDCDYFLGFPGSVSIGSDLLRETVKRICDSLYPWGARRFVIVNGHGGNTHALEQVCRYLDGKGAVGVIINWWVTAGEINPVWKGGHGAGQETSAVLAIDPNLVDKTAITDTDESHDYTENLKYSTLRSGSFKGVEIILPRNIRKSTDNGWFGKDHPKYATEEWGKEMLSATAEFITQLLDEIKKLPLEGEEK